VQEIVGSEKPNEYEDIRLGHSSTQITLDTYSHVALGLQDAAAKRFDEIFQNAMNSYP
jgi:hypothetical protein